MLSAEHAGIIYVAAPFAALLVPSLSILCAVLANREYSAARQAIIGVAVAVSLSQTGTRHLKTKAMSTSAAVGTWLD